ncbi:MAG: hypothetical protein ORN24_06525 [Burkholderiales bacterium]|nr:hypothetical protein [Burkholderiales bacterium]
MKSLIQQKLLLKNPIIDTYKLQPLVSSELELSLETPLKIPLLKRVFTFSCFISSIDGKIAYPDKKSGLFLAGCNYSAEANEILLDAQYLMLARAISDAIIIGTNSLNIEPKDFIPTISNEFLLKLRTEAKKSVIPTIIILCQNLANIDFTYNLFNTNEATVIICCFKPINQKVANFTNYNLSDLAHGQSISAKSIIYINSNIYDLFIYFYSINLKIILNESPYYHHLLTQHKLLDEIWLNYCCSYIGGNTTMLGQNQESFTTLNHPNTEILTLHHAGYHFLYSRQKFIYR